MKKFLGLLKKECVLYRSSWFVAIIAGLIFLSVAEYITDQQTDIINDRLIFTSMLLMISCFFVIFQFLSSIRNDIKTKEIWLHSTSSIAQLVGMKMIFTLVSSIIFITIFSSIGLYSSEQFNDAALLQIVFLQSHLIGTFIIIQSLLLIIVVLLLALNIQLKRYIGRFAFIFSIGVFFMCVKLQTEFHESTFYGKIFYHGEISLKWLAPYLPETKYIISLGSRYVVEDLVTIIVFILLYIVATKWFEKVVLR